MFSRHITLLLLLSFHLVFCSFGGRQNAAPAVQKRLAIRNMKLVAWQVADKAKGRTPVEVHELLETKPLHLLPSDNLDVECEIVGGEDDYAGDYFVWTTVDFLVAPVTRAYEQMDKRHTRFKRRMGASRRNARPQGSAHLFSQPDESRNVAVKGLDLRPVIAAFPVGEDGELWPWLVRVTVHVQDRSGKQVTSAERTLRLSPNSARKKTHYNDPLPSR